MKFNYEIGFSNIQKQQILDKYGLESGRTQKVIDSAFMGYLDKYMPADEEMQMITSMYNSTKVGSGEININASHAHYQNEGELYVDPKYQKGAFHDQISGRYWSRPRYTESSKWQEAELSWRSIKGRPFYRKNVSRSF